MKLLLRILLVILCGSLHALAQNSASVTGIVVDGKSNPVNGASVRIINSNLAVVTDEQGKFSIAVPGSGTYSLSISAIGYATQSRLLRLSAGTTNLNITLQDANLQLNEVIVTAQKREEDLQKLPISISSISAAEVQEYQLRNIKDISAIVPNLYSANPGDYRNVTSIRGITTTSYDPAVATYVDGVNQFGLDTYISQLLDVERIEVLRGPQGTLYGRNAMGGVINIITKQPGNQAKGFLQAEVGNFDLHRYTFGVSTPLVPNKLYLGLSGLYTQQGGFYQNTFNNTRFDKQNSLMGNYYLRYLPSSAWAVTLNIKHNSNRNNGAFPLAGNSEEAFSNSFKVNQNDVSRMNDDLLNTSLSMNYSGRNVNFSSQTAYQSNYRIYKDSIDADFSPADIVSIVNDFGRKYNNVKVLSQEFKLSSAPGTNDQVSWTAGLYGFYQHNPTRQEIYFGDDAELFGAEQTNFSLTSTSKAKSHGIAAFGQATYNISEGLNLTIGARIDRERRKMNVLGEFKAGDMSFETRPDTSASATYVAFSPQASFSYSISDKNTLYASYNRGFRAGGLTSLASDPREVPLAAFSPEYSNNYEIGSKNSFLQNRLTLNAALFYTRVTDVQVPTLILPDAITITQNAGELRSRGAELELDARLFKGLNLEFNLGLTDAEYRTLDLAQGDNSVNLSGKRQIFTPKTTSFSALSYTHAINKGLSLHARGEWRYLDRQYFDLANTISQKDYSLLSARAGVSTKRVEAYIWGMNLGDARYIDYAYNFGAAHLGNPRTYGITLRTNF